MTYDFAVVSVHRVLSGDTVDLRLDVGFHAHLHQRIVTAVVDAPGPERPGFEAARLFTFDWLRERQAWWVPGEKPWLRVTTYAEARCGWVGDVYDRRTGDTLSAALLAAGLGTVCTSDDPSAAPLAVPGGRRTHLGLP